MLVFVYGTLTDPERAAALLDDWSFAADAELAGLHRVEGEYPTLAPGGSVEGRLLVTDEMGRLDAYEGVDSGLYVRIGVPLVDDGSADDQVALCVGDQVAVYVGDPERLGADASWPGEGDFTERVATYVAGHEVEVRRLPDRRE